MRDLRQGLSILPSAVQVIVGIQWNEQLILSALGNGRQRSLYPQILVGPTPGIRAPAEPEVGKSIREPAALEGDRVELGADVLQLDDRARDPDALDVGDVLGAGQGCEDADDRDRDRELDECEAARATHGPPSGSGASADRRTAWSRPRARPPASPRPPTPVRAPTRPPRPHTR